MSAKVSATAQSTFDVVAATGWSREQVELIKRTVAAGATDAELALFLATAKRLGLDPFARQIHFVKRRRKNPVTGQYEEVAVIQIGIDGFRALAERTGKLRGIKRGVILDERGNLVGAWAEVYRADWTEPVREEVRLDEYCQRDAQGRPVGLWATMPAQQLKKCAEAMALRIAFPQDLSGVYVHEEMDQAGEPVVAVDVAPENKLKPLAVPASGGREVSGSELAEGDGKSGASRSAREAQALEEDLAGIPEPALERPAAPQPGPAEERGSEPVEKAAPDAAGLLFEALDPPRKVQDRRGSTVSVRARTLRGQGLPEICSVVAAISSPAVKFLAGLSPGEKFHVVAGAARQVKGGLVVIREAAAYVEPPSSDDLQDLEGLGVDLEGLQEEVV